MKYSVLVIGLGRFGSSAARELMRLGHDVLAVDRDEHRVNEIAPNVTQALQVDASDADGLKAIGAGEFDHAIVAISGDAEPSIFAKAGTALHGTILERVGADRVVYPEREIGARVAHLFPYPSVIDYLDIAPGFGITMLRPPKTFIGKTIAELDLGKRQLSPVALRRGNNVTVNPHGSERIVEGDQLILVGKDAGLEGLGQ
jgi:trk system potassium uptake protein TrkA